jgi:hypothetical protein
MDSARIELGECPFCEGKNVDLFNATIDPSLWFVQCLDCGLELPSSDSNGDAVEVWNVISTATKAHRKEIDASYRNRYGRCIVQG